MVMNCAYVSKNLIDIVEENLADPHCGLVKEHCVVCDKCRERIAAFDRVWQQWGEAKTVSIDAFFLTRLEACIEDRRRNPFVGWGAVVVRAFKGGLVVAGLVGCVYAGAFLASESNSSTQVEHSENGLFEEVYYSALAEAPQGSASELYLEFTSSGGDE